ncbi:MAG: Spy/CpxP family protein refolding chaperone [Desulfuromonadaceae bacterium]|nr:Spy/CpxP family protein refolding chaperone [Desulfuromonadaceae bacterium]
MKFYHVIITTLFATLLISTSAMAWGNCKESRCNVDCGQGQQGNHLERMAVILDLSPAQQQQLAELRTQHQSKSTQMRTEMKALLQELRASQPGADLDLEALKAKARTYADLKATQLVNRIEHKQQMFSILTPAQQEKAASLKAMQQGCANADGAANCNCPAKRCCSGAMGCDGANAGKGMKNPCAKGKCR